MNLWIMLFKIFEYLFYWFIKGQLEDHGPFQSLSRLWGHHAHLAVFINYVLSNSDPSSLVCIIVSELIIYYIYLNQYIPKYWIKGHILLHSIWLFFNEETFILYNVYFLQLFYLITDLYKEGNAKEMKKWAYEIHSSFLVPGAVSNSMHDKIPCKLFVLSYICMIIIFIIYTFYNV